MNSPAPGLPTSLDEREQGHIIFHDFVASFLGILENGCGGLGEVVRNVGSERSLGRLSYKEQRPLLGLVAHHCWVSLYCPANGE